MKPNLLFLYTDEQAFNTLATYGNRLIQMPHLNRLADQSVVFDQAYVTQPVCSPSRSSLLTGLYPHTQDTIMLQKKQANMMTTRTAMAMTKKAESVSLAKPRR